MAWENSLSYFEGSNPAAVESAVEALFSILIDRPGESREWARDFVFDYDSDPAGDTMALSNEAVADFASGSRVSVPGTGGNGATCEIFSVRVPLWSQNGLFVGVNVWYMKGNPVLTFATPGQCDFHEAVGRFVQGQHGETIIISTTSGYRGSSRYEYVAVNHFASLSSMTRHSSCILCDAIELSKRPKSPSTFALACMAYSFSVGERSFCPACLKPPNRLSPCVCQLPFDAPSRALDFAAFLNNASIFNNGTSRNDLKLYERESCDAAFALRLAPSFNSVRTAFGGGSGKNLCDILRALGVRYRMSLGVIPALLPLNLPRDPSGVSKEQEGTNLTVHNPSQALDAVRGDTPGIDSATPIERSSLSTDATQGVNQFATFVTKPLISYAIASRNESEINPAQDQSRSASHMGLFDPEKDDAPVEEEIQPALDSEKDVAGFEMERRRIERNRISAARYNLRKREERENLRASIEQWREKENELKEREKEYVPKLISLLQIQNLANLFSSLDLTSHSRPNLFVLVLLDWGSFRLKEINRELKDRVASFYLSMNRKSAKPK